MKTVSAISIWISPPHITNTSYASKSISSDPPEVRRNCSFKVSDPATSLLVLRFSLFISLPCAAKNV
ncbi:hypothetical protein D3C71_2168490 [compost metagenome]